MMRGTQSPIEGSDSSIQESTAPRNPKARAMVRGRTRNPPRRLYTIGETEIEGVRSQSYIVLRGSPELNDSSQIRQRQARQH